MKVIHFTHSVVMTNFYFDFFLSIDNERQPLYVNAPPKPRRIHNEMEYPSIENDVSMFPLRYTISFFSFQLLFIQLKIEYCFQL